jgi:hypothetical protein
MGIRPILRKLIVLHSILLSSLWYDLDGHFNMLHLVCLLEFHIHQGIIVYSWGLGHGWSVFCISFMWELTSLKSWVHGMLPLEGWSMIQHCKICWANPIFLMDWAYPIEGCATRTKIRIFFKGGCGWINKGQIGNCEYLFGTVSPQLVLQLFWFYKTTLQMCGYSSPYMHLPLKFLAKTCWFKNIQNPNNMFPKSTGYVELTLQISMEKCSMFVWRHLMHIWNEPMYV